VFSALIQKMQQYGSVDFSVRVRPGAKRTAAKSVMADGTIKIDIAAAPEDGKANAELIHFLADAFSVPKSHVHILRGQTSKTKTVQIRS
jgi:hypothetical protein